MQLLNHKKNPNTVKVENKSIRIPNPPGILFSCISLLVSKINFKKIFWREYLKYSNPCQANPLIKLFSKHWTIYFKFLFLSEKSEWYSRHININNSDMRRAWSIPCFSKMLNNELALLSNFWQMKTRVPWTTSLM